MRRVVVTGLGVLSPLGSNLETLWQKVSSGISGIQPLTRLKLNSGRSHVAGEVRDYIPEAHFDYRNLELLDRFAQFAIVAARAAAADAGIGIENANAHRKGVSIGSAYGGVESSDASYRLLYGENAPRLHPLTIPRLMHNAATSQVSMHLGAKGPSLSIATACASSSHAIGEAFRTIKAGAADVMFAGGSDAPLTLGVFKSWEAMRALAAGSGDASAACRPFSVDREGLVIGEGAAVLILEDYEHARARKARPYAEIVGYGATSDSAHITQPSVEGPACAMQFAMQEGGIAADEIDYINAHGTGTKLNDVMETRAIHEVFKSHARGLSISSSKSMHGHLMGASGAVELAITVLAIQKSIVPPTANYHGRDPECDLDYTPNEAMERRIRAALCNSFAFGGLNAVLAVRSA
ncbi:MAG TPA: beta-ketoacyl-[acyl-carrier-protein] synthase family protein [Acidobacteriota bacterium]|jgi:nodulation protein E|nr:beta-ketoacyl-[acyl-carrier-protein] synthase family protein [Acidobacteriota bacterium]